MPCKLLGCYHRQTFSNNNFVGQPQILFQTNEIFNSRTRKQQLNRASDNQSFQHLSKQALIETENVLSKVSDDSIEEFMNIVVQANKIACLGVGREGLCMKGLAMRLFHLGLQCSYVGEMTVPSLGAGDLLIVSAGPGFFSSVDAIATVAKNSGAKVALFTSLQDSVISDYANCTFVVPAQTMAEVEDEEYSSVLQLGSAYELALWTAFDILAILLQKRLNVSEDQMSSRHTNLE